MRRWAGLLMVAALGAPLGVAVDALAAPRRPATKATAARGEDRAKMDRGKPRRAKTEAKKRRTAARGEPRGPSRTRSRSTASPRREDRAAAGEAARPGVLPILARTIVCPPDMVAVAGRVCVDRFETSLVDAGSGAAWSPFYTPDLVRARDVAAFYQGRGAGRGESATLHAALPLPPAPTWVVTPRAISVAGAIPQGHLSGDQADAACRGAGKRLCTESEWLTACRGEDQTDFPYGDRYQHGTCNVWRENHPSSLLHGNAARYHDDPRSSLVTWNGEPLLRRTGATSACASRWGDDAIFDMVGNLDEWVDDRGGTFLGGFYSRGTRSGCFARVSSHVRAYADYSTGTRCCADPSLPG
jgi:sulfatase modifying factor 1